MFWTEGSKKPLSLRVHATWPCMPYNMFPVFFISPLSMIIILFAIRKDVPLYIHFTSSKQNNNTGHPCRSYCPQGNISSQKYFKEFISTYILSY